MFIRLIVMFLFLASTSAQADDLSRLIYSGNVEKIEEFLAAGIDVNAPDERGKYPLEIALGLPTPHVFLLLVDAGGQWRADLAGAPMAQRQRLFEDALAWIEFDRERESLPDGSLLSASAARRASMSLLLAGITPTDFPNRQRLIKLVQDNDLPLLRALILGKMAGDALCLAIERQDRFLIRGLIDRQWELKRCSRESSSGSPLAAAIKAGDQQTFDELIRLGAGRQSRDLALAVARQDEDMILDLLEAGARRSFRGNNDHHDYASTPLAAAIKTGNRRIFEILLAKQSDITQASEGITPLELAARHQRFDMVFRLLEARPPIIIGKPQFDSIGPVPDPEEALGRLVQEALKDKKLARRLMARCSPTLTRAFFEAGGQFSYGQNSGVWYSLSCPRGSRLAMIDVHLAHGFSIDEKNARGQTLLFREVLNTSYQTEFARELLKRSASTKMRNSEGHTPLSLALEEGRSNLSFVRLLAEFGADPNFLTPDGKTALEILRSTGPKNWNSHRNQWPRTIALMCDYLDLPGVDIDQRNGEGATALMVAAKKAEWSLFRFLYGLGASTESEDKKGLGLGLYFWAGVTQESESRELESPTGHLSYLLPRGYSEITSEIREYLVANIEGIPQESLEKTLLMAAVSQERFPIILLLSLEPRLVGKDGLQVLRSRYPDSEWRQSASRDPDRKVFFGEKEIWSELPDGDLALQKNNLAVVHWNDLTVNVQLFDLIEGRELRLKLLLEGFVSTLEKGAQ